MYLPTILYLSSNIYHNTHIYPPTISNLSKAANKSDCPGMAESDGQTVYFD